MAMPTSDWIVNIQTNNGIMCFSDFAGLGEHFYLKYDVPEVQEASKNLPGACGSIFPEYQPMAIHSDPIHPQHNLNCSTSF